MRDGRLPAAYSKDMRRRFGLWPAWLPDAPLAVGDIGHVRNGLFLPEGNLGHIGIPLKLDTSRAFGDHLFMSNGVRKVRVGAGTRDLLPEMKAGVRVELGNSFGIFAAFRECVEWRLSHPIDTAARIVAALEGDDVPGWTCVVTGVIEARAGLIAVGSDSGGTLEFGLTESASDSLAWLDTDISILAESNIGFRSTLGAGSTPLFRLSRLSRKGELVPRGGALSSPRLVELDPREPE